MPYASIDDLPALVRAHLPPHAQETYRGAVQQPWNEYDDEATAHRVAWAGVKRKYQKSATDGLTATPATEASRLRCAAMGPRTNGHL
jgi:cation transport regulator